MGELDELLCPQQAGVFCAAWINVQYCAEGRLFCSDSKAEENKTKCTFLFVEISNNKENDLIKKQPVEIIIKNQL